MNRPQLRVTAPTLLAAIIGARDVDEVAGLAIMAGLDETAAAHLVEVWQTYKTDPDPTTRAHLSTAVELAAVEAER